MAYTDITLTLNDDQQSALALALGYQTDIPDPSNPGATMTNPEAAIDYIERWFIETAESAYIAYMEASLVGGGLPITLDLT